jgi:uroporphyrinogen decarboxylase
MDHDWLVETFGGRLAFYGGISTQGVLPAGSPQAVRAAVVRCAATLAPRGTGLVIGPSHRMMTDIPMENVTAVLEAFAEMEKKQ